MMSTSRSQAMFRDGGGLPRARLSPGLARAGALLGHLFSFECVFFFYLYSNIFNILIPKPPVDETVIMAGLTILAGLAVVLREGFHRPGLVVLAAWFVFLGWVTASMTWSPSVALAKTNLVQLASFDVVCIAGGGLIVAQSRERVVRFLVFLLLGSLFVAAYGLWISLTYGSFRFNPVFSFGRLYLLWGYGASAGGVIAYTVMLYSRMGSIKQIVFAFFFVVSIYFLLVASGRGPLLCTVLPCMVPFFVSRVAFGERSIRVQKWQISAILILLVAIGTVTYLIMSGFQSQTLYKFQKLFESGDTTALTQAANRLNYWPAAISYWLDAPIVGQGISSFSILYFGREDPGAHAHNLFLEIVQSYGLVGLALFAFFLWTALTHVSRRRLATDPLLMCVFLLFLSRFISAQFSVDLPKNREMLTFLAMLVMRPRHPAPPQRRR